MSPLVPSADAYAHTYIFLYQYSIGGKEKGSGRSKTRIRITNATETGHAMAESSLEALSYTHCCRGVVSIRCIPPQVYFRAARGYPSKSQSGAPPRHLLLFPHFFERARRRPSTTKTTIASPKSAENSQSSRSAGFDTYRTATIGNVRRGTGCDVVVHHLLSSSPRRRETPTLRRKGARSSGSARAFIGTCISSSSRLLPENLSPVTVHLYIYIYI